MIDWDNLDLDISNPPTEEELLAEAKAWGFETVEAFYQAQDAVLQAAYEEHLAETSSE